ncbi:hypothetical protein N7U66_11975 [Lacinutrix neustonica]|uniref:Uncharacterized protein n=1 Tax=Lacinutrix neustonica TaxID=2980107 RepID=A0A9E8SFN4_9FLAO|nr:hypothetical protein [Lacinutrix neustonica]WAC00935.1 hypothetical protein N7U66_11975 [Lacinutrix neustonica]
MLKKTGLLIVILVVAMSCHSMRKASDFKNEASSELNYFDLVNQRFTGGIAYKTTAFVEKYWRVVGNTGFNESVYEIAGQLEKAGFVLEEKALP